MKNLSLEYSRFALKESPNIEEISDLILRLLMNEHDSDKSKKIAIGSLVNFLHNLRANEDEEEIPVVENAEDFFFSISRKIYGIANESVTPDVVWDDEWPVDCLWHKKELTKLAKLQIGQTEMCKSEIRKELLKMSQNKS